jgi:transposase
LLLFGENSNLPFYYRKLAGHVPDVKTIRVLLRDLDVLGYSKVKLVTDRGFYSQENINGLYQNHVKFLMSASTSLSFIKSAIESLKDHIMDWSNYLEKYDLYASTKTIAWNYSQVRPNKGDTLKQGRRMYLHLYFNPDRSVEDARAFSKRMAMLHQELSSGMRKVEHEKEYEKYFELKKTLVRGIQVKAKQDAMEQAKSRFGYFALLSNEIKSSEVALEIYRNKDVVEKAFSNIKQRLNGKRMLVSSEAFLGTRTTRKKLDKAEELGVVSPETHYLLGIIYNEGMHWKKNQDNVSPIASKLENLTIKKLISDVFE